jgi:NAD(P)-dependent dehydrogenase (short-subunit alcohol dehydrogenase family)
MGLLDDKVALVTGAASGIGAASARAFAREGARLVLADVCTGAGEAVAHELREAGADACFVAADVSREADVAALVKETLSRFGRLDCALNNAGITGPAGPLHTLDTSGFERVLAINLLGAFLCMKHEIPAMIAGGGGAIVNVSSGAGLIATPGLAAYCASKHGILGLTKTAAVENARSGVRVNAICPGSTDTPMLRASMAGSPELEKLILRSQPGGRLGRPEEIAEAALFLCSDRASFVSGESMLVDGAAVAR